MIESQTSVSIPRKKDEKEKIRVLLFPLMHQVNSLNSKFEMNARYFHSIRRRLVYPGCIEGQSHKDGPAFQIFFLVSYRPESSFPSLDLQPKSLTRLYTPSCSLYFLDT